MRTHDLQKLVSENATLKRILQQKEKKLSSTKEKVNELTKKNKSINNKLKRSKERTVGLKASLDVEQKKTLKGL
jgi:predicted  nucleic acid-binding Zn-ribbon protein